MYYTTSLLHYYSSTLPIALLIGCSFEWSKVLDCVSTFWVLIKNHFLGKVGLFNHHTLTAVYVSFAHRHDFKLKYELWNAGHSWVCGVNVFNATRQAGWIHLVSYFVDIRMIKYCTLYKTLRHCSLFYHQVDTHWMFESGIMDVFVMLGPGPKDVSRYFSP